MSYASWPRRGPLVARSLDGVALKRVTYGAGTRTGAYAMGADELPDEADQVVIRRVDGNVTKLVQELEADAQRRKITVILTAIGVAFAAVKLGFIDFPTYLRARSGD